MSLPQPLPPQSGPQLPMSVPPHRNRQVLAKRRAQNRSRANKDMALEVGAMMGVNAFFAVIALVTIVKLIPHNATQQEQLQSLESEVTALDNRVESLRKEFVQYFDPQQAQVNKRQLSDRLNAGQRKIILTPPAVAEDTPSLEFDAQESGDGPTELTHP